MQPFRMIIDRPFFCAIEDRRSGALLFVGAIYDPAA
jgi:serpin B